MRTHRRSRTLSDFSSRPLVAAVALALAPVAAQATSIVVTSNADSGPGTLRDAITTLNSACTGSDVISFSGPFTIDLASDLPWINCGGLFIVGGGNQNGSTPGARLTSSTHGAFHGLVGFASPQLTVEGMEIYGFNYGGGIGIWGNFSATNNRVHNNTTGIEAGFHGSVVRNRVWANTTGIFVDYGGQILNHNIVYDNGTGISIQFQNDSKNPVSVVNNFVGVDDGSAPGTGSSGNDTGIFSYGSTVTFTGNTVSNNNTGFQLTADTSSVLSGNKIGTSIDGSSAVGNFIGVALDAATSTQITGNVISGNSDYAIDMVNTTTILIDGNAIGTDASRSAAILNGGGVHDDCGSRDQISNNVVGTLGGHGIDIGGVFGGGDLGTIVSNKIGVRGDGVTPLGNNAYGIFLSNGSCGGSSGFSILGNNIRNSTGDGIFIAASYGGDIEQNTITANRGYGVNIVVFGNGNQMLNNKIYGNATALSGTARKNVNLDAPGAPRPNDSFDSDSGPNDGQNWPNIDSVLRDVPNNRTIVNFTLDSCCSFTIEAYANPSGSHVPGGEQRVATLTGFTTDGPGSGQIFLPGLSLDHISLTATETSFRDTSEFSPVVDAQPMPSLVVSPSSVDFGNVTTGTTSAPRTISVVSAGGVALDLQNVADACYGGTLCYGGDFTCSTTCVPGSLGAGSSCEITATFHPSFIGSANPQTIFVCTNNAGIQTVTLNGTGAPPPIAELSPSLFDFGPVAIRTKSPPADFTLTNRNPFTIGITAPVTSNADFQIAGTTCSTFLRGGDNCDITVVYAPGTVGSETGQLMVGGNAGDVVITRGHGQLAGGATVNTFGPPPAVATLTGSGVVQANLTIPDALDLGAYLTGAPALTGIVTLTASGNATVNFSSVTVDGPFTLTNNCPSQLNPGESCNVILGFSQQGLGDYTGSLTVVTDAQGGTRTVQLTAHTVGIAAPHIKVSPATIGFGDRMIGTQSATQRITITSDGTTAAVLSPITSDNLDYLITATTCGVGLDVGASCTADVALRPVGFGFRPGLILVNSNSPDSPAAVKVGGTGCRPFNAATARLGGDGCAP